MAWLGLIIQIIAGVVGGNAAGTAVKGTNLNALMKSVIGAVGGIGGGQLLLALTGGAAAPAADAAAAAGGLDIATLLKDLIGGGAGGAILTGIIAAVTKGKKA